MGKFSGVVETLRRVSSSGQPERGRSRHPSDYSTNGMLGTNAMLDTPWKHVWTWRVIVMTALVSLGGMIFGYGGIGAIGGFLVLEDYRNRFGTPVLDVSIMTKAP